MDEIKPTFSGAKKSSMEILSELFGTFDAEPPVIIKKEKSDEDLAGKKHKKSKKKHKHKDKKHKKKKSKRKRSSSSSSNEHNSELDLAKILIKQEKDKNAEQKIKIEGTSFSIDIPSINFTIKKDGKKIKSEEENTHKSNIAKKTTIKKETTSDIDDEQISKFQKHKNKHRKYKRKRSSYSSEEDYDDEKTWSDSSSKRSKTYFSSEVKKHYDKIKLDWRGRDEYSRDRYKSYSEKHESRSKYKEKSPIEFYRDDSKYKSRRSSRHRSSDRSARDDKWAMRDRYRGHSRDRFLEKKKDRIRNQTESDESSSRIDKKKLLEIARKNAITMMKSDKLPEAARLGYRAQEKMIAAIKSGGKTIEELTEFCKSLSKKEELGELSSIDLSDKETSDVDEQFHHPFLVKDRPLTITMNIKNSIPLPTKTTQERTTELRMQFPVSSGQQHRVNEEWIPVSPPLPISKSPATTTMAILESNKTTTKPDPPLLTTTAITEQYNKFVTPQTTSQPSLSSSLPDTSTMAIASLNTLPSLQVLPTANPTNQHQQASVDITTVISQRLVAMRRLQENPNDVQALTEIYKSNKEMQNWAQSKQQPGQFTGSTGVQILSPAALASGAQAWAKKDQLQNAAPVSGGMGMHLLQKMGWKPGEGLGKEKTGALEPLLLEVKLDKKGLVANEEHKGGAGGGKKKPKAAQTMKTLQGKHPVSLLGEYASKKKLGPPQYELEFECGPDHKKNFLFKVILNGVEYKPNIASPNKKEAKANAATIALQQIGLLS